MLRAADSDAWGDSISGDLLVKRSLIGLNQSTISVLQGVGIPVVEVKSAVDVVVNGQIQGVVIATIELDSGFVDKVKSSTKLESAIYANNILTATTLTTPGNNEKLTGTKLTNKKITKQVLINGNNYHGEIVLNNQGMIGSILPIKDVDGSTIGMLVVAEPDSNILILAGKSIQTAFLITPVLILLSILPLAFITRKISRQLE